MADYNIDVAINGDSSSFEAAVNKASKALDGAGSSSSSFGKLLKANVAGNLITSGINALTGAAKEFGKEVIDVGSSYEAAMSQVQATMGITADSTSELNGEVVNTMDALGDLAQKMGSETAFSAAEAADAINILAMAGKDTEEIYGMLPDVLNLAAAGGMGIADAADIATGVMAGFGIEAEHTAEVADMIAMLASSAKGSVKDFGAGLSTVAGQASSTGQSMEDMAVALGILGNHNISAAEGGNALNRVLKNLYQPTAKAKKAMDAFGVSAYDAEGNARPLQDVLGDFNEKLDGMSDEAKNEVLSQIFDASTLKTIPFLLNDVTAAWDTQDDSVTSLVESVKGASNAYDGMGAAAGQAGVQLDNFKGQMTLLSSASDGLKIALYEGLQDTLAGFAGFGSEALSKLTEGFKTGGVSGLIQVGIDVLNQLIASLNEKLPEFMPVAMEIITQLLIGLTQALPSIFEGVTIIINGLITGLADAAPELIPAAIDMIGQLAIGIVQALPTIVANTYVLLLSIADAVLEYDWFGLAVDLINALIVGIQTAWPIIIEKIVPLLESIWEKFEAIWQFIKEGLIIGWTAIADTAASIWNGIVEFFVGVWTSISTKISEVWEAIKTYFVETWDAIYTTVSTKIGDVKQWLADRWDEIKTKVTDIWDEISTKVTEIWTTIYTTVKDKIESVKTKMHNIWEIIKTKVSTVWDAISTKVTEIWTTIYTTVKDKIESVKTKMHNIWEIIKTKVSTVWDAISTKVTEVWTTIYTTIKDKIESVKTKMHNIWEIIKTKVSNVWDAITTKIQNVWTTIFNTSQNRVEAVKLKVTTIFEDIRKAVKEKMEAIKTKMHNIWEIIKVKVQTTWTNIKDSITNMASKLTQAAKDALQGAIDFITGLPDAALQWGKDIIQGIIDGIGQMGQDLIDSVAGVGDIIADFLGFSEPEKGPLSNFHTYMPDMFKLMTKGIRDSMPMLESSIEDVAGTIYGGLGVGDLTYNTRPAYATGNAGGSNYSYGGINVTINAAEGQNEEALADYVIDRLQHRLHQESR